ncbi:hypothetical protein ACVXG7_00400 [Enterobacter hormaechei]
MIETVAEPESFPIRLVFPTLRLFILCDLSQGVASLSAARSAERIANGSSDVFREYRQLFQLQGMAKFLMLFGLEPGNYPPVRCTILEPIQRKGVYQVLSRMIMKDTIL